MNARLKSIAKRVYAILLGPLDILLVPLSIPAAAVLWVFRRVGAAQLPITRDVLRSVGVFPVRRHYYEPMFDTRRLARSLKEDRRLPGLDLGVESQLELVATVDRAAEIRALDWAGPPRALEFRLGNTSFGPGDAEFLYSFLRHLRPRRVIEIGGGHSTRIIHQALTRNREESGTAVRHICIEPFHQPWLERLGLEIVRRRVEECPADLFQELQAGDFLFIDSSHIIRPQGDVLHEYLDLLPTLPSGTFVHVHDIFTPRDYRPEWIQDAVLFWNEQYLLEALLSNSHRYRVVAALNHLKNHHFDALARICPHLTMGDEPGSFYFAVR